jgi:hypothetical protein
MANYQIEHDLDSTPTIIWAGAARDAQDALERMARAAGFTSWARACEMAPRRAAALEAQEVVRVFGANR